jgi:uncharacterized low-complexity protein
MNPTSMLGLALSLGTVLSAVPTTVSATPFQVVDLASGYMLAATETQETQSSDHHGMCGEGMCGTQAFKSMDTDGDGKLTEQEFLDGRKSMHQRMRHDGSNSEGCCGGKSMEGSCGGKQMDGRCGGKHSEGSCGEGNCGAKHD